MITDRLELMMEERIGEVLNECKSGKEQHYEKEQSYLDKMDEKSRKQAMLFLDDILTWSYEDLKTAYCAGLEDGIRISRKILSV